MYMYICTEKKITKHTSLVHKRNRKEKPETNEIGTYKG
jgi:hypothetical protein